MKHTFLIRSTHNELFAVSINGYIIMRISHEPMNAPRQDVQFEDLPPDVQTKIIDKITEVLS